MGREGNKPLPGGSVPRPPPRSATAPRISPSNSPRGGPSDPAVGGWQTPRPRQPLPSPRPPLLPAPKPGQRFPTGSAFADCSSRFLFPSGLNCPRQDPKSGGYSSDTHAGSGRDGLSAWEHADLEVAASRPRGPRVLACSGRGGCFEAPGASPAPAAALGQSSAAEGRRSRKRQSCSFTNVEFPEAQFLQKWEFSSSFSG